MSSVLAMFVQHVYCVTLFLNICSILRESDIIHKKIRNYLEGKMSNHKMQFPSHISKSWFSVCIFIFS